MPDAPPVAIAPTPAEASGSDDGLDGAAGAVGVGRGLDFDVGFAVGRGVGFGAGFGAGLGFGFVITTRLGETAVSVTDRAPEPLPLEAVKRYAHFPAGSLIPTENVTPVWYAVPPLNR